MSDMPPREPGSKPNVYFIDDSATMREVIKLAFRRENINVVACSDMAAAVAAFDQTPPDAIISDVIMPDKDGYQLCEFVKQHPLFSATPVFLMSGVVNKQVAERANEVKADELIRKPFHPPELVARVKKLFTGAEPAQAPPSNETETSNPLSQLFAGSAAPAARPSPAQAHNLAVREASGPATPSSSGARATAGASQELQKVRMEIKRLESLVKKLQNELASEREYSASLESQIQSLTTAE